MEQPCEGKTKEEMLKLYKQRVFYYIQTSKNGCRMRPCILDKESIWKPSEPRVVLFDDDMRLGILRKYVFWDELYDSWNDARSRIEHIDKLYNTDFWIRPYVEVETLEKHKDEMVEIEKLIKEGLKNYSNFLGIDFCDVNCNGIQIRGHHKEITSHAFGVQPTLKYDFTNKDEVIHDFIEMWKINDVPEEVESYKRFLRFGNKYGWD